MKIACTPPHAYRMPASPAALQFGHTHQPLTPAYKTVPAGVFGPIYKNSWQHLLLSPVMYAQDLIMGFLGDIQTVFCSAQWDIADDAQNSKATRSLSCYKSLNSLLSFCSL